jgi:hypothetical protein
MSILAIRYGCVYHLIQAKQPPPLHFARDPGKNLKEKKQ